MTNNVNKSEIVRQHRIKTYFYHYFFTDMVAPRDCSDYNVLEAKKNGMYRITPDPRNGTFEVFCDMESYGGGWTVIQQRLDGSVSFNRTWAEYKKGFGNLRYWHLLIKLFWKTFHGDGKNSCQWALEDEIFSRHGLFQNVCFKTQTRDSKTPGNMISHLMGLFIYFCETCF